MRVALTVAAVLFGIPLLFLTWLYVVDGKVVFVRNPNKIAVSVQIATLNDSYAELSDPKAVGPGALAWIIYNPQIKGDSGLLCTGMRGTTRTELGTLQNPLPTFSSVTLDSCEGSYVFRMFRPRRKTGQHHMIAPPQPMN